ncbi:MAG: indolepyruvate ferredoxin oxidoreductase subunit alpha, partial [Clostridia bacterium]
TEILENISAYPEIISEWAPNEKVAAEASIGASIAGVRALTCMKHVGVNVAADPLFTFAYTGVGGGFVVVSADDPGMHSSQNEQDNRNYAKHMKIAMMEPSDSQECLDMMADAFAVSEKFDVPMMLRVTTRICHSKSMVNLGERSEIPTIEYVKNTDKYDTIPAVSKKRRVVMAEREKRLLE